MFALIGTVAAQEAELEVTADVPSVLIIQWENQRSLNWVFNYSQWSTCSNGEKIDSVCFFNDGSLDSAADLYMESNADGIWNVDFTTGDADSYLHRVGTSQFTPVNTLNMTRHDELMGDEYAPVATKDWTFDTDDNDCDIDPDLGGSCDVGIELQQGITEDEVSPGSGRLKQGTYAATIIATMTP